MNIFVVNSGSSSIKYQLFKMPSEKPVCTGLIERIGLEDSIITHKVFNGNEEKVTKITLDIPDHEAGLKEVVNLLTKPDGGVISDTAEIDVVGHRLVHGGEAFSTTAIINKDVKEEVKKLFALAPLHNPPNYLGVEVAERIFTKATQVGVFDTAFHQTMPEKAFRYAIPTSFYKDLRLRAYGFHGTSHKYVAEKACEYLGNPSAKLITLHLGNGCSMTAIKDGMSVDTSLGFGTIGGLIMGTRCGDVDPSLIFHLLNTGYDPAQLSSILHKKSGMLGLTGYSDMREIGKQVEEGNEDAKLAMDMYCYRIKKYIGSYAAVLNGVDAIVFTAGVGENDVHARAMVCESMDYLGITLDVERNAIRNSQIREINKEGAAVKVLVIPTNEELEIAKQCYELVKAD